MAKVERFEDLIAWQKARELTKVLYRVTGQGPFIQDRALAGQMRRAAVSVMANLAEGFERNRPAEFHQYISMSKGSCGEVRSHLYAALDAGHLPQSVFAELLEMTAELGRILGGLRASVARTRDRSVTPPPV